MKNKELRLGIDEFTLVLRIDKSVIGSIDDWEYAAGMAIIEFADLAKLELIFGKMLPLEKVPQGYAIGYKYGNHPFYFALAFHPDFFQMGIVCKFSAYAWAEYCHRWEAEHVETMNLYKFLGRVKSEDYEMRLSRIDFTADYMNYHLVVDTIYKRLTPPLSKLIIRDAQKRKSHSKLSAMESDKVVSTFYVGSKKANVNTFLRVYDKKAEQINHYGFRLQEAEAADDWVRFEVVFRGTYAHQLTDIISHEVKSDQDLQQLIADKITEKYQFYDIANDKPTDFTQDLINIPKSNFNSLSYVSPRDNDLRRSVNYLRKGSGLYPTFYKIEQIWGNQALQYFVQELFDEYTANFTPNADTRIWLNKHKALMSNQNIRDIL